MLKRLKDVDYDGFVGLMGRRSVAKHKSEFLILYIPHFTEPFLTDCGNALV